MRLIRSPRQTPAAIIVIVALIVTVGSTATAVGKVNGKKLKDRSVPGIKLMDKTITAGEVADETLTGQQIDESTLGAVPPRPRLRARSAQGWSTRTSAKPSSC